MRGFLRPHPFKAPARSAPRASKSLLGLSSRDIVALGPTDAQPSRLGRWIGRRAPAWTSFRPVETSTGVVSIHFLDNRNCKGPLVNGVRNVRRSARQNSPVWRASASFEGRAPTSAWPIIWRGLTRAMSQQREPAGYRGEVNSNNAFERKLTPLRDPAKSHQRLSRHVSRRSRSGGPNKHRYRATTWRQSFRRHLRRPRLTPMLSRHQNL